MSTEGTGKDGRAGGRPESGAQFDNVLPFPGDWLPPRSELIPFGSRADRLAEARRADADGAADSQVSAADSRPRMSALAPAVELTADDFWGGDSDSLCDAPGAEDPALARPAAAAARPERPVLPADAPAIVRARPRLWRRVPRRPPPAPGLGSLRLGRGWGALWVLLAGVAVLIALTWSGGTPTPDHVNRNPTATATATYFGATAERYVAAAGARVHTVSLELGRPAKHARSAARSNRSRRLSHHPARAHHHAVVVPHAPAHSTTDLVVSRATTSPAPATTAVRTETYTAPASPARPITKPAGPVSVPSLAGNGHNEPTLNG